MNVRVAKYIASNYNAPPQTEQDNHYWPQHCFRGLVHTLPVVFRSGTLLVLLSIVRTYISHLPSTLWYRSYIISCLD